MKKKLPYDQCGIDFGYQMESITTNKTELERANWEYPFPNFENEKENTHRTTAILKRPLRLWLCLTWHSNSSSHMHIAFLIAVTSRVTHSMHAAWDFRNFTRIDTRHVMLDEANYCTSNYSVIPWPPVSSCLGHRSNLALALVFCVGVRLLLTEIAVDLPVIALRSARRRVLVCESSLTSDYDWTELNDLEKYPVKALLGASFRHDSEKSCTRDAKSCAQHHALCS